MKTLRLACLSLAVAALLPSVTSCTSDRNPFEREIPTTVKNAVIQLRLNIEDTRAGENSTADEKKITKLFIYVFDDKQVLEDIVPFDVTEGTTTVNLEVTHGLKTLYVISAKTNVNLEKGKTSLSSYENSIFDSSLTNIITEDNGFVMVGKSKEQYVRANQSQENLPSSNIFNIKLVRLVAKAQVKCANINGSSFGISFGEASFKAFQLNEKMRVFHNGSDVLDSYVDHNNGTYNNYTRDVGDYCKAVTSDFTADGCVYMSENIVAEPKSGNTTFLGVRVATKPEQYYTFDPTDSSLKIIEGASETFSTYYAVGIQDKVNGIVDYALDHSNQHIVAFKDKTEADNYMKFLNTSVTPANTMSQNKVPLYTGVTEGTDNSPKFEVLKFEGGYAYYRVNIAHEETSGDKTVQKIKVMRNNFYKVNINSVGGLGFSQESLLYPTNPETALDSEGSSLISVSITVADWDEVEQDANLR